MALIFLLLLALAACCIYLAYGLCHPGQTWRVRVIWAGLLLVFGELMGFLMWVVLQPIR